MNPFHTSPALLALVAQRKAEQQLRRFAIQIGAGRSFLGSK